jgi:hypothetical protein
MSNWMIVAAMILLALIGSVFCALCQPPDD